MRTNQERGLRFAALFCLQIWLLYFYQNWTLLFEDKFGGTRIEEGVKKLTLVADFLGVLMELHLEFWGSLALNLLEKKLLAPVNAVQLMFLREQDSVEAVRPVQVTIF